MFRLLMLDACALRLHASARAERHIRAAGFRNRISCRYGCFNFRCGNVDANCIGSIHAGSFGF